MQAVRSSTLLKQPQMFSTKDSKLIRQYERAVTDPSSKNKALQNVIENFDKMSLNGRNTILSKIAEFKYGRSGIVGARYGFDAQEEILNDIRTELEKEIITLNPKGYPEVLTIDVNIIMQNLFTIMKNDSNSFLFKRRLTDATCALFELYNFHNYVQGEKDKRFDNIKNFIKQNFRSTSKYQDVLKKPERKVINFFDKQFTTLVAALEKHAPCKETEEGQRIWAGLDIKKVNSFRGILIELIKQSTRDEIIFMQKLVALYEEPISNTTCYSDSSGKSISQDLLKKNKELIQSICEYYRDKEDAKQLSTNQVEEALKKVGEVSDEEASKIVCFIRDKRKNKKLDAMDIEELEKLFKVYCLEDLNQTMEKVKDLIKNNENINGKELIEEARKEAILAALNGGVNDPATMFRNIGYKNGKYNYISPIIEFLLNSFIHPVEVIVNENSEGEDVRVANNCRGLFAGTISGYQLYIANQELIHAFLQHINEKVGNRFNYIKDSNSSNRNMFFNMGLLMDIFKA